MRILLVAGCLAVLLCGAVPTKAQGSPVTVDTCRVLVDQYGVPEQDPVLTFQGGSQQAAQVAFCQSLALTAGPAGTDFEQLFTTWADINEDGTVDDAELAAYFTAVRSGELPPDPAPNGRSKSATVEATAIEELPATTPVAAPFAPPTGGAITSGSPRTGRSGVLLLLAAITMLITALLLVWAQRGARRLR